MCLNITQWPVDVSQMDLQLQNTFRTGTASQMAALEAVGLVIGMDTQIEGTDFGGKPNGAKFKVRRYTLTDAAKPFERTQEVKRFGLDGSTKEARTDLCWGKKTLEKVVKWEGPMKLGDYQEATVTFQYKINGLADWAKKPEILAAFPYIGQITEDAGKEDQQRAVKLTSAGWEAKGLSD
ncbi:hypothetical protein EO087_06905 [Dyella sp. M7H15-1]|uniref:hypothetical protein n=1 Tax=Dyella sp. M7H15-1 TaxID=2501295 RepID=UPI001005161D|nr:hypothetical protein [Dyella sp. M7H15-1]QAU23743.1 hypothetical protein EO087_06905 [Dyella sp. M7H15-1]